MINRVKNIIELLVRVEVGTWAEGHHFSHAARKRGSTVTERGSDETH